MPDTMIETFGDKETLMPDVFQFGPSGGTGGNSGDTDSDEGSLQPRTRVADVLLSFDDTNHHALESIQFIHENLPPGGGVVFVPRHGGSGHEPITVSLDTNEHITKISGTYNLDGNKGPFVTSISIETNTGVHNSTLPNGGVTDGAKYSYEAPDGVEVVGFFGRSGSLIDAIGVVMRKSGA